MSNYFKKEFFETLLILKNYLSDLVIAGGWGWRDFFMGITIDTNLRTAC